jgi:hypothetical protein
MKIETNPEFYLVLTFKILVMATKTKILKHTNTENK